MQDNDDTISKNIKTNKFGEGEVEHFQMVYDTLDLISKAGEIKEKYDIDLNSFVKEICFNNIISAINDYFLCFNNQLATMSPEQIIELLSDPNLKNSMNDFTVAMENEDYELAASILKPLSSMFKCDSDVTADDLKNPDSELNKKGVQFKNQFKDNYLELANKYTVINNMDVIELENFWSTAYGYSSMLYGDKENQTIYFAPPRPKTDHQTMMKDPKYKDCFTTAGVKISAKLLAASGTLATALANCGGWVNPYMIGGCMTVATGAYAFTVWSAYDTYNTSVENCMFHYQQGY